MSEDNNGNKKAKIIAFAIYSFIAIMFISFGFVGFKIVKGVINKKAPEKTEQVKKDSKKTKDTKAETPKKEAKKDGLFTQIGVDSKDEDDNESSLSGIKKLKGTMSEADMELQKIEASKQKKPIDKDTPIQTSNPERKLIGMGDLSEVDVEILNKTAGKNFGSMGDEITFQDAKPYIETNEQAIGYQNHLSKYYNIPSFRNFGIDNATVVDTNTGGASLLTRYTDVKLGNVDYLFLMVGANDYKYGVPLGNVEDINSGKTDTFYGAYSKLVDELKDNSESKIQLWTPTSQSLKEANDKGYFLEDYVNAIRNIGRAKNVSVCNLNKSNQFSGTNLDSLTSDGVHPNNHGYEVLAVDMINCINPILD